MPTVPEPEDDTIVVTGRVPQADPEIGGFTLSRWVEWAVYIPSGIPDPLTEEGGNQLPQVVTLEMIDGNVVVRLPGYDFALRLPAADWADMTRDQRGAFIKMMNEFRESPRLVEALNHLAEHNVSEVVIRYDNVYYDISGAPRPWAESQKGHIAYQAVEDSRGINIIDGTAVIISINSSLNRSAREFATTLAHELRHPVVPGVDRDLMSQRWTGMHKPIRSLERAPSKRRTAEPI